MNDSAVTPSSPAPQLPEPQPQPKRKGLLRSSAVVAAMTMVSRVLGLARDVIFAQVVGVSGATDAFFVAFKIPNFLRRLFAEGAFSQAFVPVLSEYRAKGPREAVQHFIDRMAGNLSVVLLVLTILVVLASPVFAGLFGLGFLIKHPEQFSLTADLLRITFPYLFLISLTGLAGAILNSYDRFAVPAITPVFLNIVLILFAVVLAPMFSQPVFALAWGVLVAGTVQLLFQVPFLMRLGLLPHPKVDWHDESVKKVLRLMAPAMFGVSISQINLLLDTVIATFLPCCSVTWLYFSDRLTELPLGVFGVGIATVILPRLSRQHASEPSSFSLTLDWALRMVLLVGVPAALALFVIAEPVLYTLFQYGKYASSDIVMASYSLRAYALGLTAFMLIKVLVTGYFARQDTRTPVKIGIFAMSANMVMNIMFVVPLHYFWQVGHAGLALATSVSAFMNGGLLLRGLLRQKAYSPCAGWWRFCRITVFANVAMAAVLFWGMSLLGSFEPLPWWHRCLQVLILCSVGFVVYCLFLFLGGLRIKELRGSRP